MAQIRACITAVMASCIGLKCLKSKEQSAY